MQDLYSKLSGRLITSALVKHSQPSTLMMPTGKFRNAAEAKEELITINMLI